MSRPCSLTKKKRKKILEYKADNCILTILVMF